MNLTETCGCGAALSLNLDEGEHLPDLGAEFDHWRALHKACRSDERAIATALAFARSTQPAAVIATDDGLPDGWPDPNERWLW